MSVRTLMLLAAMATGTALVAQETRSAKAAKAFQLDALAPAPNATPTSTAGPTPVASPTPDASPAPEPSPSPEAVAAPSPAVATPAVPDSVAVTEPAPPAASTTRLPGFRASFTLDTPIADLIADPAARAVLDKDLPGLSNDQNLDKFAKLGLRQFQPLTGGQLTDAMLLTVAGDLSRLSGPMLAPIAPTAAAGTSRRNRDTSR